MFSKTFAVAVVAAAGVAGPASADVVLGSVDLFFGFAAQSTDPAISMGFGVIADADASQPENRLFAVDQVVIGSADVGTTWVTDEATAAAIRSQFADDDLDDGLGFYAHLDVSPISGRVMEGDLGDDLDFDLIATDMDEMHVTLLMWETIPNQNVGWSDYLFRVRYEFISTAVPAPGAVALLGAAGLLSRRRRRR